jgi:hypothetical protein
MAVWETSSNLAEHLLERKAEMIGESSSNIIEGARGLYGTNHQGAHTAR